jgi:hypothetical protein
MAGLGFLSWGEAMERCTALLAQTNKDLLDRLTDRTAKADPPVMLTYDSTGPAVESLRRAQRLVDEVLASVNNPAEFNNYARALSEAIMGALASLGESPYKPL